MAVRGTWKGGREEWPSVSLQNSILQLKCARVAGTVRCWTVTFQQALHSWVSGASLKAGAITRELMKVFLSKVQLQPHGRTTGLNAAAGILPGRSLSAFENAEDTVQAKGVGRVGQEEESAFKADPTSVPEKSCEKPIIHGLWAQCHQDAVCI